MGSSSTYKKKNYLSSSEIELLSQSNPHLNQIFSKYKNSDGFITIDELEKITDFHIKRYILKKIIQICGKNNKLNLDDFKYFYSLLNCNQDEIKINFILDFLFLKNSKLTEEKYLKKIHKYFQGSKTLNKIFLSSKITNEKNFSRNFIHNLITSDFNTIISNFSFLPENENLSNNLIKPKSNDLILNNSNSSQNSILILNSNKIDCSCLINKNNNKNTFNNISPLNYRQYDKFEKEFQNIERMNNRIFPLKIFEKMLKDLNINSGLIEIISNYIKQKTLKNFLNFNLFKEVLNLLNFKSPNIEINKNEIINGLFILCSYPKDFVKKKNLFFFFKSANANLSSKQINSYFEKYHIENNIDKEKFTNIIELIYDELSVSYEHLRYLSYIFFKVPCTEISLQKNCIEILFKNHNNLKDYVKEIMQFEDKLYAIDMEFFNNWNKFVQQNENLKKNDLKNLRIMTNKISDRNGKINEGLQYLKDYLLLPQKMYDLFVQWYGPPIGPELKRTKIFLENDSNNNRIISNKFIGIDFKTKKKFEFEIFPIFLLFFNFDTLQKKNGSFDSIKESLKQTITQNGQFNRYYPFSRQTKFLDLLKTLEDSLSITLETNKSRLWIYYQEKFEKVEMKKTLEEIGIVNSAIIVLEIFDGTWPSERIQVELENEKKNNFSVGLMNLGNTCYLNSVLQVFLNNVDLKEILFRQKNNEHYLKFLINPKSKGKIIREFINLLKEKYDEEKKTIIPKKFKEICGEYDEQFNDFEQQDAHEFLTSLITMLHEDTNIKTFITLTNNENLDEGFEGNFYWANNIRNDASYIHSLYLFQLKSTSVCSECKNSTFRYETFSSLSLPIPEGNKIILDVILFRLPFTLKSYLKNENSGEKNIRKSLLNIQNKSIGIYANNDNKSSNSIINVNNNNNYNFYDSKFDNTNNLTTFYYEKEKNDNNKTDDDNLNSNILNFNIPIRIRIEVNRKEKCSKIIEIIKNMKELKLEKNFNLTYLIIINNGKFIDENCAIEDYLESYRNIYVYEILNFNGITETFDYKDLKHSNVKKLDKNLIKDYINFEDNNNSNKYNKPKEKNKENIEILIPIQHRYRYNNTKTHHFSDQFIPNTHIFQNIPTFPDYILLSSKSCIKTLNLYEMIWEKYSYFLDSPSKFDKNLWFKYKNSSNNYKPCCPFVLKFINKYTKSCAFCPWFRFCNGCVLDPHNLNYIGVDDDFSLVVEWCRDVFINDINEKNYELILNHESLTNNNFETIDPNENKATLKDCLNLFMNNKEIIKEYSCDKCKKKTNCFQNFEIERLPKYLILHFKRFKKSKINPKKIEKIEKNIEFPFKNLDLSKYIINQNNLPTFDLCAIINHRGQYEIGHYSSYIKNDNFWIKYDDSFITEYESENNLETNSAYMLVYKMNDYPKGSYYFNYKELLDTAFNIYVKNENFAHEFNFVLDKNGKIVDEFQSNCLFYFGEPVKTEKGPGYVLNAYKDYNNNIFVDVKLNKGSIRVKLLPGMNIKETLKMENNNNNDLGNVKVNNKKKTTFCDGCKIF